jgi:predicted negative regulator of RcsB-dependent stress response
MAKRIILISSFPVCIVLVIIALVLAGAGYGQSASTPADVEQAKSQSISLVNLGKLDDANAAVDKLIADYANNAHLASNLVGTAGQYAWDRNYDGAQRLYHAVIDNHPDNPFVTKARVGLARLNVLTLIEEKKYSLAEQQVESMAVDFNSEPDLPVALFHIGKEFT